MRFRKAKTKEQQKAIKTLYRHSFPRCERKPFWMITAKQRQGMSEIWYIEEKQEFIGLAITMRTNDLVLLDYFAIAEDQRGRGLGSRALRCLQKHYKGKRFFLEIESTREKSRNAGQRRKRKQFYLQNRMTELGIEANVFGTQMELLGYGCSLTEAEYMSVYRDVYGTRWSGHVRNIHRI